MTSNANSHHQEDQSGRRLVLLMALLPGLVGLFGFGHFHIGRKLRGALFFSLGMVLWVLAIFRVFAWNGMYILPACWFVFWVVQSFDAYTLARGTT